MRGVIVEHIVERDPVEGKKIHRHSMKEVWGNWQLLQIDDIFIPTKYRVIGKATKDHKDYALDIDTKVRGTWYRIYTFLAELTEDQVQELVNTEGYIICDGKAGGHINWDR